MLFAAPTALGLTQVERLSEAVAEQVLQLAVQWLARRHQVFARHPPRVVGQQREALEECDEVSQLGVEDLARGAAHEPPLQAERHG